MLTEYRSKKERPQKKAHERYRKLFEHEKKASVCS